jgi:hypothetical protein
MAHFHHEGDTGVHNSGPLFWAVWFCLFVFSKVEGLVTMISDALPADLIAEHEYEYFPKLREAIPSLILASGCALASWITTRVASFVWSEYIKPWLAEMWGKITKRTKA